MRLRALLALLPFLGCATPAPKPQLIAWTVPRWQGPPGEVTLFARVNHSTWQGAALEIAWGTTVIKLKPEPDLSWVLRVKLPEGRHTFRLWVLLDGEVKAFREVSVRLSGKRSRDR